MELVYTELFKWSPEMECAEPGLLGLDKPRGLLETQCPQGKGLRSEASDCWCVHGPGIDDVLSLAR
eukprot:3549186-Alexandrium_andersonii.AAC.1